jgi:hypothetical protein
VVSLETRKHCFCFVLLVERWAVFWELQVDGDAGEKDVDLAERTTQPTTNANC